MRLKEAGEDRTGIGKEHKEYYPFMSTRRGITVLSSILIILMFIPNALIFFIAFSAREYSIDNSLLIILFIINLPVLLLVLGLVLTRIKMMKGAIVFFTIATIAALLTIRGVAFIVLIVIVNFAIEANYRQSKGFKI